MISVPAVIIPCYNRVASLQRLINSLLMADYGAVRGQVTLVFSLDFSGSSAVARVAEAFEWPHGEKRIIKHKENIGLRRNIISCGDLTDQYDAVIVLEDDLVVAPNFYLYSQKALQAYRSDFQVAQVSLYAYEYSEIKSERFHPLYVGFDSYFLQWPSSRGQVWTQAQWTRFKQWYNAVDDVQLNEIDLPINVQKWPATSWKKYFLGYLISEDLTCVYPYHGFSTNYGESGMNHGEDSVPSIQSPISFVGQSPYRFMLSDASAVSYDCYFQPTPAYLKHYCAELEEYDFTVDLLSMHDLSDVRSEYLLTTRKCMNPNKSYSWNLFPVELNVIMSITGEDLYLVRTCDVEPKLPLCKMVRLGLWFRYCLEPFSMLKYALAASICKIIGKRNR